jgi:hypothetical protein
MSMSLVIAINVVLDVAIVAAIVSLLGLGIWSDARAETAIRGRVAERRRRPDRRGRNAAVPARADRRQIARRRGDAATA